MLSARRTAIIVASLSMALAGTAATAQATPKAKAGSHCTADLSTHKTRCYDSFREVIAAATGGRVTDAPATPQQAAKDKKFLAELNAPANSAAQTRTALAQNTVVGGILYEDWNYGGSSLTLTIPSACKDDGQWDWGYNNLDDWNDRVSSVIPAGNCYVALYSDIYYNGTQQQYNTSTPYVGDAMNDRASSVKLL
ncbi:peptidase inhibitor family I36 protein [Streptomyces sp. cg36]|uniref:peptidase inhibitor family I36 protein n=1 Tax=Streptomyces sp. cg36 TaxID=3238798 RepID=UPI0034E2FDED